MLGQHSHHTNHTANSSDTPAITHSPPPHQHGQSTPNTTHASYNTNPPHDIPLAYPHYTATASTNHEASQLLIHYHSQLECDTPQTHPTPLLSSYQIEETTEDLTLPTLASRYDSNTEDEDGGTLLEFVDDSDDDTDDCNTNPISVTGSNGMYSCNETIPNLSKRCNSTTDDDGDTLPSQWDTWDDSESTTSNNIISSDTTLRYNDTQRRPAQTSTNDAHADSTSRPSLITHSSRQQNPPYNSSSGPRPIQTIRTLLDVEHEIGDDHDNTREWDRATRDNTHLLGNVYIGDTLSLPKNINTTCIYCQNIHGITLSTPETWEVTCEHLLDMEVDTALFMEHKLNTSQPRVSKQLYDTTKNIYGLGTFTINATSTPISSSTTYKPGGVLSLVTGDIKGRVLDTQQDPFGRWVYSKLQRNMNPPITIVATYQIVDVDPHRSRPTTFATQLLSLYTRQGRPNPEKLCHHHADDLVQFIKHCQHKGEWFIVAGDLNEVLGSTTRGLTRLHSECGLIDAALDRHGLTNFTTYQRGKQVIDYILVDQNILQCATAIGYEPFNIHILSNH